MDSEDLEEEWDSERDYDWDNEWKARSSSNSSNSERDGEREDSSNSNSDWDESWDESDDSSQIEIIDLIERRDCDTVEILRAVIPIKGTYNNRSLINRSPPTNRGPLCRDPLNRPVTFTNQPLPLNNPSAPLNQPLPLNNPPPNNTPPSLFNGEDITFLNVRLKENKYKPSFFKDLIHKEYTTCSICLCTFTNYSKVLSLLCTHYFHSKCIIPWIKKHKQCPCCREGI
ncbi:RING finger protein 115 [Nosema bombycis CQ1]|uniref:RING finger protein 115 n=1 Tax=Nosema bombycis (strain CQ1 / CVCC 102059) TaxID=578461 RepID=R0MM18_NOSB1|nr:RING finger protein 115 [Nosema bombycis CQ1]|eukprot:EOB15280.1 RING finger protein 115 [Nosema bombycis CQ1]